MINDQCSYNANTRTLKRNFAEDQLNTPVWDMDPDEFIITEDTYNEYVQFYRIYWNEGCYFRRI